MKILLLSLIISTCHFLFAQTPYEIKTVGATYSSSELLEALSNANFCHFYYSDKRRLLNFDDGAQVELLSKNELPDLSDDCFIPSSFPNNDEYWEVSTTGVLIRRIKGDISPDNKIYIIK